jgi:UDP-glucuronate 4-epimerase
MRYIEVLEQCLGKEAQKYMLPMQPGDVKDTYADVSDLVADVDYKPSTSIEEGVKNFVDWYRDYFSI